MRAGRTESDRSTPADRSAYASHEPIGATAGGNFAETSVSNVG